MSEEKSSNMFSNAKLSTIFMVVLGLHVVVIVLISAYHLLKGDTSVEMTQRMTPPEPRSYESILTDEADMGSPEVVTAYNQTEAGQENAGMDPASLPLPMPAANDPIWTGQAPMTTEIVPRVAETSIQAEETFQPVVDEASTFRAGPMTAQKVEQMKPVEKVQEVVRPVIASSGSEYTVRKGDTLSGIASRHGVKVSEIQQANSLSSSMIRIGQKLTLPGVSVIALAPNPTVAKAAQKPAPKATVVSTGTYTVNKGDTLWKISRKFSTTPQAIASMNGISDPSKLRVGDTLKVPNASSNASTGAVESSTDMAMMPTR